jgi:hypothetical protein
VHTGQGKKSSCDIRVNATPKINESHPLYARSYIMYGLACHFAGTAQDTPIYVEVEATLPCHYVFTLLAMIGSS